MNQDSNLLEGTLAIEVMYEPQFNLEEKVSPSILEDHFSSRADSRFNFTLIEQVLLDWSNETS